MNDLLSKRSGNQVRGCNRQKHEDIAEVITQHSTRTCDSKPHPPSPSSTGSFVYWRMVLCTYGTNEFAQDLGLPCAASKFETQMQNSQAKLKTQVHSSQAASSRPQVHNSQGSKLESAAANG
jgi:hypothetical protein